MAETSVGGVSWFVDADTTGAVESVRSMSVQVDKAEVRLAKLDRLTGKYTSTLKKSGNIITDTGTVINKYGKVNEHATIRMQKLIEAQAKFTPAAVGVNKAVTGMSRNAGMAGIQFQQFIGQVQGGQSVMLALSQQSADLGFVLGAPLLGAIIGITASIGGMLLPSLLNGKTALETVEKAVENVRAAMTLGADGVAEYSDEMKKLRQISAALAEIKVAGLIAEQNEAFKVGIKETVKLMDDARDRFALGQFKLTKEGLSAFTDLNQSIESLKVAPTVDAINKAETALLALSRAGVSNTKQGRELTKQMGGLISEYKLGKITIAELQKALVNTNVITDKAGESATQLKEKVSAMVSAIQEQGKAVNETNRQTAIRIATEDKATTAQLAAINAAFDSIESKEKQIKVQKELDKAMSDSMAADAANERRKSRAAAAEKRRKARELKADTKEAVTTTESIIQRGQTPEEKLQFEADLVQGFRDKNLITAQQYQDALTQIDQEGAEARLQITAMAMGSFSDSFGQLAGILKNSEGEQSNAYKAMFALSKGFAIAQAGLNLSLAISNAMASGPFPWNMSAMTSVGAAGMGLISSVAGASYAGRENGGPVNAGTTYEMGEKNKPELLVIPGNNGKVLSNSEMKGLAGGGGAQLNQTINNYASNDGYQVQTRGDGITAPQVIDIIRSEMGNANSHSRRALGSTSNVDNKARSRR